MVRVTGIGGVFFKTRDKKALGEWYRDHLGVELESYGGGSFMWRDHDNPERVCRTVWGPFEADTNYFDPSSAPFMINYRVDDLDAALSDLREAGVEIVCKVEEYDYGKFGWVLDPEGNKIELWEPRGEEGQG